MFIFKAPLWTLKLIGRLLPKFNYGANIVEALNKYPETFEGTEVWDKLGKPVWTLQKYASKKS